MKNIKNMKNWISVGEKLPPYNKDVLVALENGSLKPFVSIAWCSRFENGTIRWFSQNDDLDLDLIRWWMPIPEINE